MAIAIVTTSTKDYPDSGDGDVVIDKPSGLEVGDLMFGIADSLYADATLAIPSGWTGAGSVTNSSGNGHKIIMGYKVAEAADVAASNFTFSITGGTRQIGSGLIYRITGYNAANLIDDTATGTSAPGSNLSFTGFTPTKPDDLYIFAAGGTNHEVDVSAYAIATDNPSWTESVNNTTTNVSDGGMGIAWAIRPENSATGTVTATFNPNTNLQGCGILIALSPSIIISLTETVTMVEGTVTYLRKIVKSLTETIDVVQMHIIGLTETVTASDTYLRLKKAWQNTAKNISSWVNQDKS